MADSDDGGAKHTLTRREAGKLAGAAAGAVAAWRLWPSSAAEASTVAPAQTTPPWNHDPASPIGPLHWGTIGFPTCGSGMGQSPVNIDTSAVTRLNGPPLLINYERSELGIENTGHVVEVPIPAGVTDTLRIGNDAYPLVQYHFHAPGEHQVNGRLADIEGHFVHQNSQGDTAVVGIFYRTGADPNPLLDKILISAPVTAGGEVTAGEASPAELFPGAGGPAGRHRDARLVLHLHRLAHHPGLHRGRALVRAGRRRPRLARGRTALPLRDLPVPQLRRLPQQQPARPAAERPGDQLPSLGPSGQ